MPTVHDVASLVKGTKSGRARHRLVREDDYVRHPKTSGYRAHHLVYEYRSEKNETFNGMRIEVQIRSQLQHAWAMAVETVDVMEGQTLKTGGGDPNFARFFSLGSSLLAIREKCHVVPDTYESRDDIVAELRDIVSSSGLLARLWQTAAFASLVPKTQPRQIEWYLLDLTASKGEVNIRSYGKGEFDDAIEMYNLLEQQSFDDIGRDVVLVAASSISQLKRAYPSYFNLIEGFVSTLTEEMEQV